MGAAGVAATAKKTDPALWDAVKAEVTAGDKGGHAGQWSARKAQMATAEYKKRGGGYAGAKAADNHLSQWTHEEWGTRSGGESLETGERYLPKAARAALSDEEYARTTRAKRADMREGRQHSAQPADIAKKTAPYREHGGADGLEAMTRAALLRRAAERQVAGRSRMTKAALIAVLS